MNSFSSIVQLHDKMVVMDGIGDRQKSMIAERMGVRMIYLREIGLVIVLIGFLSLSWQLVDKRLMDGADEFLQLMDLCSVIMDQLCHTQTH